jgi:cytochrome oxidase Cu insertion factor (SCO1/SenC/PrrC family)
MVSGDMVSASQPGPAGAGGETPGRDRRRREWRILVSGVVAITLAGLAAVAILVATRPRSATLPRPSGIPASVSTSLANLMQLSPLPHRPAPGFTLTDQNGRTMPLSALRGKVVVLEFMDPHCVDICPIVSQEFVDAYHDLGRAAGKVVFAAINVNQYHASVAAMAGYSREHGLAAIPSWHFFTGPVPALQAAWREYDIMVQAPNPDADIIHTSAVYFISPTGQEMFVASPMVDHTRKGSAFLPAAQLAAWGQGIALLARHLAG